MHHANLLIGNKEWALAQIHKGDSASGVDVTERSFDRMSMSDVRTLKSEAQLRPFSNSYRIFILVVDSVLQEAQNALLKLFEEPNNTTIFYIVIPSEDILLPTLRSRLQLYAKEPQTESTSDLFVTFKNASYTDRLALIGDRLNANDTAWITEITKGLEYYAHATRNTELMRETLVLLSRIHTAGGSKKMLLEHIALTL